MYGDIGTSPLYALKEAFAPSHGLSISEYNVFSVLSMMFWLLTILVSIKYVLLVLRADNKGEGGDFALLALNLKLTAGKLKLNYFIALIGILGGCLFYSDAVITPAISVLSAVEGLKIITPQLDPYIIPITLTILICLFMIQRFGTGKMGVLFGPITFVWFASIGFLGLISIIQTPNILFALNPYYGVAFAFENPHVAFMTLGVLVLVVTGAEALYADMGHFGRKPIQIAWFSIVCPCLTLNYFGQGALLLRDSKAIENPFYLLVPEWGLIPMVILATAATTIASQATISGAFSLTRQAIQLGFLPRMKILHTSEKEFGQIYIPLVNWMMLISVLFVVVAFKTSSGLAAAYGIAVSSAMFVTTFAVAIVMLRKWRWNPWLVSLIVIVFASLEGALVTANMTKIASGGWLPMATALLLFVALTTWFRGQKMLTQLLNAASIPVKQFIEDLSEKHYIRVPGTAVYMTPRRHVVPDVLVQNLKHNKVLHEKVILLTALTANEPRVNDDDRLEIQDLGQGFFRVLVWFGFMEETNIRRALTLCRLEGLNIDMDETSFFLGHETVVPTVGSGMALWREHLYSWMKKNGRSAVDFYHVPQHKVLEIATRYEI